MRHSHITKHGDSITRPILDHMVFVHMRRCPESKVRRTYDSVSTKAPKKVALTAASNKLLDIIYTVLSTGMRFHA